MVLAAGAGRRLRPDTDSLPKALLPVARLADGEVTILDIALRNLAAVGLTDIVVVVGYAAEAVAVRAAALEQEHGVTLTLVHNDRAEEWNNAYSLWLARDHFAAGALLVNGDTVHPVLVEKTLLAAAGSRPGGHRHRHRRRQDPRRRGDEGDHSTPDGRLTRITKLMDPALAHGEYIGATLIERAGRGAAGRRPWRRPGGATPACTTRTATRNSPTAAARSRTAPIGAVDWVEVDNHDDLRRAREIAGLLVCEPGPLKTR